MWGIAASSPHVFSPNSVLNIPLPANPPIHADTAAMIQDNPNWFIPSTSSAYPFREWLGPRQRTCYVKGALSTWSMYVNFVDFVGAQCATSPKAAAMFSSDASGQFGASSPSFDRSSWFVDSATGSAYEGYRITAPGITPDISTCDSNRWNATRYDIWPNEEISGLGYGRGIGASGSKIQMGCGLIRPEEMALATGSDLGHCLRIDGYIGANGGTSGHPRFVFPAGSGDGVQTGTKGIPIGARIQLDPSLDIETWATVNVKAEPWREGMKKILRTLQKYGAMPVDSTSAAGAGGIESVYQMSYSLPWIVAGYGWSINNGIPYDLMDKFRVIDWNRWTGQ